MKTFPSPTTNGGTTIILDSVAEAVKHGQAFLAKELARLKAAADKGVKFRVGTVKRDGYRSGSTKTMNASTLLAKWKETGKGYDECVHAITKGDPAFKERIAATIDQLRDLVLELEPQLAASHSGFERSEDGITAAPELVACGDDRPCFQRKPSGQNIRHGEGDGAYRIVINTDVSWWGDPRDNAAVMGALVVLLQQFKPVEIWIQQGWRGSAESDGVTLFKLDFTAGFDATQLAFWCGHPMKDSRFSWLTNLGLGRKNHSTAIDAELPADLYLRGDWMEMAGINASSFTALLHSEKVKLMSKWLAATAMKITHQDTSDSFAM